MYIYIYVYVYECANRENININVNVYAYVDISSKFSVIKNPAPLMSTDHGLEECFSSNASDVLHM